MSSTNQIKQFWINIIIIKAICYSVSRQGEGKRDPKAAKCVQQQQKKKKKEEAGNPKIERNSFRG